jgi:hypothetical protein
MVVRCRTAIVAGAEFGMILDAVHGFTLHRIQEMLLINQRDGGGDCDDRNGGPTMRTVRLPLSAPAELPVAAWLAVAGAAAELVAVACGVDAAGLPDGLGCDSALAF